MNMGEEKFYVTAAIPYVNAPPHMGHALEFVQADTIARFQRLSGADVFFVTGADENALKNVLAAKKQKKSVKALCDENTKKFVEFIKILNISINEFRRGSDKKLHWPGVWELWKRCDKAEDIYKKSYKGFYCVGCESFKTKRDLVNGFCPYHKEKPELVEEENYFFKLSKYQKIIEKLIEADEVKVIPEHRKKEILTFIKMGLEDFSISRSQKRARGWGIPVPGDESQIIYVWYDALTIYLTAIGLSYDNELLRRWWPAQLHEIGKDIIRFHAVYWIGMLLSAHLSLPREIFVHGFITSGGHKMSKSLGNVVDPMEIIKKYGSEGLRFYLLREIPAYQDGDFTERRFKEVYNSDLANGLGNLFARVTTLVKRYFNGRVPKAQNPYEVPKIGLFEKLEVYQKHYEKSLGEYKFNEALVGVFSFIADCDKYIDINQPWVLAKTEQKERLAQVTFNLLEGLHQIGWFLLPFLPKTSVEIGKRLGVEGLQKTNPHIEEADALLGTGAKITVGKPLFPRI
jgi:methionyl-tRNA synthetase